MTTETLLTTVLSYLNMNYSPERHYLKTEGALHEANEEKIRSNGIKLMINDETSDQYDDCETVLMRLREEMTLIKSNIELEKSRVATILKENEILHRQHQEHPKEVRVSSNDEIKVMEIQIEEITKEKDHLLELWRLADAEVNRLQAEITEYNMKPQTVAFNEQMETVKQSYHNSLQQLENEVSSLRNIKRDLTNELSKYQHMCSEFEKENHVLVEKLKFEKQAAEENLSQLKSGIKRIEILTKEKKDLLDNTSDLNDKISNYESNKNEWSEALKSLEMKYNEKEQQVYDASQKISEAYQVAENALSEKKSIEIKEIQALDECERLRGVISGILDDAGVRTREEVDLVKSKYDKEVERIMEELSYCEQNRQDLLVELDQMKRKQGQLEQEIESIHNLNRERSIQDNSSEEMSHNRAIIAERDREDIRLQLQSMENNFSKERTEWQRQKEALENEISYQLKKTSNLQASCDKAQSNADKFSKMLTAAEESSVKNCKKFQEALRTSRHEYEILKQTSEIRQQELEARLASSEETQRHTTSEMRQFLTKQQQLSAKWREEAHNLSAQNESQIRQLSKELDRQKKRNDEMVSLLHDAKQQILENQETIEDQKKSNAMLEKRLNLCGDSPSLKLSIDSSRDDANWELQKYKKQQQRLIKESVARKYDFSPLSFSNQEGSFSG